jgi:hypothetical protein
MRLALVTLALLLAAAAPAAAAPQLVNLGAFSDPVYVTSPPNDTRVFVVEKSGRIKIVGGGTFLDISGLVANEDPVRDEERGLLSMAFSPNYATNGIFYVFYTAENPLGEIRVVEYRRASATQANAASARPIFTTAHAMQFHNGGQLQFGPDGMLYVSIGDNEDRDLAKDPNNVYGKILRLNPTTGGAASGNPHGYVWTYGLRNPWRFSFDRGTGDIAIGDVGDSAWEEIDWGAAPGRARDANFGWPDSEGFVGNTGLDPILAHAHNPPDAFCAIVGGYVVRDPGLPSLNGRYLYGDNCNTSLWSAQPRTGGNDRKEPLAVDRLSSFGEDACGHIYAASLGDDAVYRLQDGALSPCSLPGNPNADTTPPGVSVALQGLRKAVKKRRFQVALRCTEACRITLGTRLRNVRRLKARHRSLAANQRAVIRLKLSKATARKLRKRFAHHRFVRVSVTVRAIDAAGNVAVKRKGGRIKRRR